MRIAVTTIALVINALCHPAYAQSAHDVAALREELQTLRAEQAKTAAKIDRVEAAINQLAGAAVTTPPVPSLIITATAMPPPSVKVTLAPSALDVSGDIRLRYEANFGSRNARNRDRGVLRARLRGSYAISNWLSVGAQLTTGDPDDPNSSDVTLSNFDDDLQVSLDQAWLRAKSGGFEISAGKIPQPFVRTDMVWDGDVDPEGIAASFKTKLGANGSLNASGLYFVVDESVSGPDSYMVGGQITLETKPSPILKLDASIGYFNYSLASLTGGDTGDFRSNRFAGGRYLSDFNLLDIIGSATWTGLGNRWPVKLTGDYVRNFGATTPADNGFSVSATIGRVRDQGDWRVGYGFASVETDAVLAAFSEDNTPLATNYIQHNVGIDYVVRPRLILSGTYYRFKPKNAADAGSNDPTDWLNRLRINLLAEF